MATERSFNKFESIEFGCAIAFSYATVRQISLPLIAMTQPPHSQPPIADKFAELVLKAIVPGGVTVGGIGAFWELLLNDEGDVLTAILSLSIGLLLSYGATLLQPLHESTQRRVTHAGKMFNERIDLLFAGITGFEGKYLLCQALDCEGVRSEGVRHRDGIFDPELKDVFVELQIDGKRQAPGFWAKISRRSEADLSQNQTIWELLARTETQKLYRQLAILAWGGSGKTTLLKHVAYRYGMGEAPQGAPSLVPVLLVLRKCREQLSQAEPPDLPTLINDYHIPSLPESNRLKPVPPTWAKDLLQRGRALVMLDGFDEVPSTERPAVVRWITTQIRQYGRSVFIVTSRPKAYRDDESADRLSLSMPLWVQPFDDEQRRNFVANWYVCQERIKAGRDTPEVRKVASNAASDLLRQIESQSELKDLAKNPLLLNMIATFHRLHPGAALPKRRVDLYGEICALQLKTRPRDRQSDTILLEFEAQHILEQIAFNMMQCELKRIGQADLLNQITQALAERDEAIDASELLEDVARISELMVQQEDEYEFAHLSFQEYLAAAYVAVSPDEREKVLYKKFKEPWWKATILLYAAKAKKPDNLMREALRHGAQDLAYECWQQITGRTARRVDHKLVEQIKENRYANLDRYLKNGEWEEADKETYRLMITEVGKEEGQGFDSENLLNFPCEPLKAIDGLWVKYSGGKFGFSVQKEMYLECGGIPDGKYYEEAWMKLCHMNGWDGSINFDLGSPRGHLPVVGITSLWSGSDSGAEFVGVTGGTAGSVVVLRTCKL